jgi:hypothetical protein
MMLNPETQSLPQLPATHGQRRAIAFTTIMGAA